MLERQCQKSCEDFAPSHTETGSAIYLYCRVCGVCQVDC